MEKAKEKLKLKLKFPELREMFLSYLEDKGMINFTYTIVREWFYENYVKNNFKFDSPNTHRLLIRELQKQGKIVQIRKNLWQIVTNRKIHDLHQELFSKPAGDEDEFDKYLRDKLQNKN